ncbi:MAG: hypothetical protein HQK76_17125 [Desulfobacterales bacterium]|nr:hypothetical protein [Desulfobacterales bacterium]
MFSTKKLYIRCLIFIGVILLIIAICYINGISSQKKIAIRIDEMLKSGNIIGAYWEIKEIINDKIKVEKFNRTIEIQIDPYDKTYIIGHKISFIASQKINSLSELWIPTKIHVHGKSTLKFLVSLPALILTLILWFRYIEFDKNDFSLKFRK